jgi:hypothetical protein
VYFGRYNGSTPVAGHEETPTGNPNKRKIDELLLALNEAERTAEVAAQHEKEHPGSRKKIKIWSCTSNCRYWEGIY